MSEAPDYSLLPDNRSALERGFERGFAELLGQIAPPFPDLLNPAKTPAAFLAYLGVDRGVPEWSSGDSEAAKRDTVAAAWPSHRLAGTREAFTRVLTALNISPKFTAWHELAPRGTPYSFTIDGELSGQHDAAREARLEARLQAAKAERDSLTLRLYRDTPAPVRVALAVTSADTADLIYPKRYLTDLVPRERPLERFRVLMNKTLPEAMNGN